MEVGGQRHVPATLPPVKTRYPLHRRLVGPQGWCGKVWNIAPPLEFDPRTVQSVASSYTDYAIPARNISSCVCVCVCVCIHIHIYIYTPNTATKCKVLAINYTKNRYVAF
jgi:hypothetical protein